MESFESAGFEASFAALLALEPPHLLAKADSLESGASTRGEIEKFIIRQPPMGVVALTPEFCHVVLYEITCITSNTNKPYTDSNVVCVISSDTQRFVDRCL